MREIGDTTEIIGDSVETYGETGDWGLEAAGCLPSVGG
jgi:hypothetical protein